MDTFPDTYPEILKPYSWNYNGHFGILHSFNKYCKLAKRDSKIFLRNFLTYYFQKNMEREDFSQNITNYINFLIKCFNISWDVEDECFVVKMKRRKEDKKKVVFDKDEFYDLSSKIGLSKRVAKFFLQGILNDTVKFYNKFC